MRSSCRHLWTDGSQKSMGSYSLTQPADTSLIFQMAGQKRLHVPKSARNPSPQSESGCARLWATLNLGVPHCSRFSSGGRIWFFFLAPLSVWQGRCEDVPNMVLEQNLDIP